MIARTFFMAVAVALAGASSSISMAQDPTAPATHPAFFQPDDVVALVGGEDMVVMRDQPDLELLVRRQPGLSGVRFRSLAFEGDTVFEQFRQLNFPTWEDQLASVGATVVIAQFGKMESLDGPDAAPAFAAAYEKLLDRLAGGTRRVLLLAARPPKGSPAQVVAPYNTAARALARQRGWPFLDLDRLSLAEAATGTLGFTTVPPPDPSLVALTRKKNWLWFHYWRPQNWAFLHGDRTEQQSSRDHRDPTIRWFPEEMKQWLPLVAARDLEIQQAIDPHRQP